MKLINSYHLNKLYKESLFAMWVQRQTQGGHAFIPSWLEDQWAPITRAAMKG